MLHAGSAQDVAHLVGQGISGCQLSLVVQHLLKVRNMPPGIGGVAVEALQEMVAGAHSEHHFIW